MTHNIMEKGPLDTQTYSYADSKRHQNKELLSEGKAKNKLMATSNINHGSTVHPQAMEVETANDSIDMSKMRVKESKMDQAKTNESMEGSLSYIGFDMNLCEMRMKYEEAKSKETTTSMEDSLSTLGFDGRPAEKMDMEDSMSTLTGFVSNDLMMSKAKGATIIPSMQDSMSAIGQGVMQDILRDLNTKQEKESEVSSTTRKMKHIEASKKKKLEKEIIAGACNKDHRTRGKEVESPIDALSLVIKSGSSYRQREQPRCDTERSMNAARRQSLVNESCPVVKPSQGDKRHVKNQHLIVRRRSAVEGEHLLTREDIRALVFAKGLNRMRSSVTEMTDLTG